MTLKLNRVRAVVKVHVRAKYHQAECCGSWVIELKTFLHYLAMVKKSENLVLWPWPLTYDLEVFWGFVRLSRNVFTKSFNELSAVVGELSCVQRKKHCQKHYSALAHGILSAVQWRTLVCSGH